MTDLRISWSALPTLETTDLILRRMSQDDAGDLFAMRSDSRMVEHVDMRLDEAVDETKAYIDKMNRGVDEQQWLIWAMEHKKSGRVVGSISLWNIKQDEVSAEFGYGVVPEYQGQSLMKQALQRVIEYAFAVLHFKTLYAYTEERNLRSNKLLERCGFVQVDSIAEEGYYSDRVYRMAAYKLDSTIIHQPLPL